jgi:16S rRNA (guanine527-N7)-methyltransferase
MNKLPDFSEIWQQTLGWQPDQGQKHLFQQLYAQVLQGNRQLNLTRITSPRDFWEKHLWDSLVGVTSDLISWQEPKKVIDIGTGAGFPGIPVAIAVSPWEVTLLDSTHKKITFLNYLCNELGLENVKTIATRAEALKKDIQYNQFYDLALVRAVGSVSVCAEYALPLIKTGGIAVLYRGHWTEQENKELEVAISHLGAKLAQVKQLTTPLSQSTRHYLYLCKT